MENKKMKNAANFFCNLTNFFKILFLVLSIVSVVLAILLVILGPKMIANITIELGELTIYFKDDYIVNKKLIVAQGTVQLLIYSIIFLISSYASKILNNVIEPVKECRPFSEETSKSLKKLAWICLIIGGLGELARAIDYFFTNITFDMKTLFNELSFAESYEFTYEINFSFVAIFCVIMFLSFIFQYGQQLQKESDETL